MVPGSIVTDWVRTNNRLTLAGSDGSCTRRVGYIQQHIAKEGIERVWPFDLIPHIVIAPMSLRVGAVPG